MVQYLLVDILDVAADLGMASVLVVAGSYCNIRLYGLGLGRLLWIDVRNFLFL
jgi:hypothetical protein